MPQTCNAVVAVEQEELAALCCTRGQATKHVTAAPEVLLKQQHNLQGNQTISNQVDFTCGSRPKRIGVSPRQTCRLQSLHLITKPSEADTVFCALYTNRRYENVVACKSIAQAAVWHCVATRLSTTETTTVSLMPDKRQSEPVHAEVQNSKSTQALHGQTERRFRQELYKHMLFNRYITLLSTPKPSRRMACSFLSGKAGSKMMLFLFSTPRGTVTTTASAAMTVLPAVIWTPAWSYRMCLTTLLYKIGRPLARACTSLRLQPARQTVLLTHAKCDAVLQCMA